MASPHVLFTIRSRSLMSIETDYYSLTVPSRSLITHSLFALVAHCTLTNTPPLTIAPHLLATASTSSRPLSVKSSVMAVDQPHATRQRTYYRLQARPQIHILLIRMSHLVRVLALVLVLLALASGTGRRGSRSASGRFSWRTTPRIASNRAGLLLPMSVVLPSSTWQVTTS